MTKQRARRGTASVRTLVAAYALAAAGAHADVAPHPVSDFELAWETPRVAIVGAALFACADSSCLEPTRVEPFSCQADTCSDRYSGARFYQLVITFEDGVRSSRVFAKHGYTASFRVHVRSRDLGVEIVERSLPIGLALRAVTIANALLITLLVEFPIAWLLLRQWQVRFRKRSILYANLLTLPVLWIAAGTLWIDVTVGTLVGAELLVVIVEGLYYRARMRDGGLTWSRAFIVSLAANAASVAIPFAFAFVPLVFEYG